jgi:hypothetical protein
MIWDICLRFSQSIAEYKFTLPKFDKLILMNNPKDLSSPAQLASTATNQDLEAISSQIHSLADRSQGDIHSLLLLLRTLEQLHREIQEGYFQAALPDNRQALYKLLRDIEENGGWPYIQRWKLQALFANLPPQGELEEVEIESGK